MKYSKFHSDSHHHHHHHYGGGGGGSSSNSGSASSGSSGVGLSSGRISMSLSASSKRHHKKHNWGTRERTGMSFLIVIAFFAVFGLIILTELFMIDERAHGGMMTLRSGNSFGRLGDSMPDYDNVKDDYDLLDAGLLNDNKLGFVQFHDNKFKIQDAESNNNGAGGAGGGGVGRLAGVLLNSQTGGNAYMGAGIGGGTGLGSSSLMGASGGNGPLIPWGKTLPTEIENSLPRLPFGSLPTDGSWQIVNGTRFKFFVFSAYYDRRNGSKLVRVIGATKTRGPERVWCRFWYVARNVTFAGKAGRSNMKEKYKSVSVMARVKVIRENWNLKYSACFILCPVRPPEYDVPDYVSIVARLRAPPGNILELRNTDWDEDFLKAAKPNVSKLETQPQTKPNQAPFANNKFPSEAEMKDEIAICVKPFHFDYDQSLFLMEFLEFYSLLGVTHFTFYNHTVGTHASCVLDHYIRGDIPGNSTAQDVFDVNETARKYEDPSLASSLPPPKLLKSSSYHPPSVQILPWNLRMRSQKEIRTEGLFAALNDCLYRTMYRYKYLALVDLDEFIVPRLNDTLQELLSSLNSRFRNRNLGAYSFQNAFFYLQFADDPLLARLVEGENMDIAKLKAALVTQRKTRRRFKLHPQKQRSKYICKPEDVIEAGNHFVWEYSPGKGSLNVPPTDAILQHYRVCEFGGNDCIKAPSMVDRTATKYVNRLVERVYSVYRHLKDKCDLPPLPPIPKPAPPPKLEMKPIIRKVTNDKSVNKNDELIKRTADKKIDKLVKDNEILKDKQVKMKTTTITTMLTKIQLTNGTANAGQLSKVNKTTINVNNSSSNSSSNSSISTTATSSTSTTTSTSIATTRTTTKDSTTTTVMNPFLLKKPHKVVVFFIDDKGQSRARLEYH
ncbi:uncharacterized protein LOC135951130 [Calliphora vicina]|uniref:uncharacterized protein LOC135951130 n=1 Tax=Calliphora vicina TaxID=7373 RepID=UPI00325B4C0C